MSYGVPASTVALLDCCCCGGGVWQEALFSNRVVSTAVPHVHSTICSIGRQIRASPVEKGVGWPLLTHLQDAFPIADNALKPTYDRGENIQSKP